MKEWTLILYGTSEDPNRHLDVASLAHSMPIAATPAPVQHHSATIKATVATPSGAGSKANTLLPPPPISSHNGQHTFASGASSSSSPPPPPLGLDGASEPHVATTGGPKRPQAGAWPPAPVSMSSAPSPPTLSSSSAPPPPLPPIASSGYVKPPITPPTSTATSTTSTTTTSSYVTTFKTLVSSTVAPPVSAGKYEHVQQQFKPAGQLSPAIKADFEIVSPSNGGLNNNQWSGSSSSSPSNGELPMSENTGNTLNKTDSFGVGLNTKPPVSQIDGNKIDLTVPKLTQQQVTTTTGATPTTITTAVGSSGSDQPTTTTIATTTTAITNTFNQNELDANQLDAKMMTKDYRSSGGQSLYQPANNQRNEMLTDANSGSSGALFNATSKQVTKSAANSHFQLIESIWLLQLMGALAMVWVERQQPTINNY